MWSMSFEYYVVATDVQAFTGHFGSGETPIVIELIDLEYLFADTPDVLIT
jgi:hypothetical protein